VNRRRISLWAPVVLYMAFIFVLSAISSPPDLPSAVSDTSAHALLYAGLGALLVRARAGGWRSRVTLGTVIFAVLVAALYGFSDEAHQYFVPPREVELSDVVADAVGAAAGAGVLYARSRNAEAQRRRGV
jgi:VanZ family protein